MQMITGNDLSQQDVRTLTRLGFQDRNIQLNWQYAMMLAKRNRLLSLLHALGNCKCSFEIQVQLGECEDKYFVCSQCGQLRPLSERRQRGEPHGGICQDCG